MAIIGDRAVTISGEYCMVAHPVHRPACQAHLSQISVRPTLPSRLLKSPPSTPTACVMKTLPDRVKRQHLKMTVLLSGPLFAFPYLSCGSLSPEATECLLADSVLSSLAGANGEGEGGRSRADCKVAIGSPRNSTIRRAGGRRLCRLHM